MSGAASRAADRLLANQLALNCASYTANFRGATELAKIEHDQL